MPMLMQGFDQIMAQAKRDLHFIAFEGFLDEDSAVAEREARMREHFAWFDLHGLRYEPAAPRGWLEGDPGLYAVYFDGADDPRVAAYTARFEHADGRSVAPDLYQMQLVPYQSWLEHDGPGHLARERDAEEWD